MAVDTTLPPVPLPLIVSPPLAPNLASLLTGHVGQKVGTQADNNDAATVTVSNTQVAEHGDDNVKSPPKKSKKIKSTKEDKSAKRNRSGSSLKKSSFATPIIETTSSAKE